jgi:hypothetical protein
MRDVGFEMGGPKEDEDKRGLAPFCQRKWRRKKELVDVVQRCPLPRIVINHVSIPWGGVSLVRHGSVPENAGRYVCGSRWMCDGGWTVGGCGLWDGGTVWEYDRRGCDEVELVLLGGVLWMYEVEMGYR